MKVLILTDESFRSVSSPKGHECNAIEEPQAQQEKNKNLYPSHFSPVQGDCIPAEVPYFNFPNVTNIENSIFLVNCKDASINDQADCRKFKPRVSDNSVAKREIALDKTSSLSSYCTNTGKDYVSSQSKIKKEALTETEVILADTSDDSRVAHDSSSTPPNNASKPPLLTVDNGSDEQSISFTVEKQFTIKIDGGKWNDVYSLRTTKKQSFAF